MKYSGSITINDDEGNIVYERELDADAIIELLLPKGFAGTLGGVPVFVSEAQSPKPARKSGDGGANPRKVFKQGKPCCGSMSTRHPKNCPEARTPAEKFADTRREGVKRRRTVDNRHPFSEPTYNVVKTLLEREDASSDMISAEKGLELEEVQRANMSNDYEDYLVIA